MESYTKCAGCGKKPTVKSNPGGSRASSASGHPPSPATSQSTRARLEFTASATQRRTASASGQPRRASFHSTAPDGFFGALQEGPERFFYDRASYTGTHSQGGPERVAKGDGSLTLLSRASQLQSGTAAAGADKMQSLEAVPPFTKLDARMIECPACGDRCSQWLNDEARCMKCSMVLRRITTPMRPNSRGIANPPRPGTRAAAALRGSSFSDDMTPEFGRSVPSGPERFFYDKSSFTGTHARGGPSSVPKGGGTACDHSWKRPF